jgi:hypothetical protein
MKQGIPFTCPVAADSNKKNSGPRLRLWAESLKRISRLIFLLGKGAREAGCDPATGKGITHISGLEKILQIIFSVMGNSKCSRGLL